MNTTEISKKRLTLSKTVGLRTATAFLLALTGLLAPSLPAAAQAPAVDFTSSAYGVEDNAADTLQSATGSFSLGFEFTADSPALVTALGYFNNPSFDPNMPFDTVSLSPSPSGTYTYAQDHQVGLYQVLPGIGGQAATSLLLASATVTAAGDPNGDFLYQSLTDPVLLITGGDYVLAGVTGPTDPYLFNIEDDTQPGGVGMTTSGITYIQDRYTVSSSLTLPTQTDANSPFSSAPGFFGPNLLLAAPVSETSTATGFGLLLVFGFLAAVVRRRTRFSL